MTKSLQKVKNEKCKLQELEYDEKSENHGKGEIHTLGREIWQGKLKKLDNLEMSTLGHGIWEEKLKIMENEKNPLDDFENEEITKICEK